MTYVVSRGAACETNPGASAGIFLTEARRRYGAYNSGREWISGRISNQEAFFLSEGFTDVSRGFP